MNRSVHLKVCSYLHTGATFSHALSSLPLCLVSTSAFSLPSDPPPSLGEREGNRGSTKYRHFPPPDACQNCYWTRFCVYECSHVDVCAAWTGPGYTLYTAGFDSSFQLPRNVETRYIRPREWLGAPYDSGTQNERAKDVWGQTVTESLCIPPSAHPLLQPISLSLSLALFFLLSPVPHRLSVVADTCLTETERQSGKKRKSNFPGVFWTAENSHQSFISINWYYYKNQYVNTIKTLLVLLSLWPYLYMNYYFIIVWYLTDVIILAFLTSNWGWGSFFFF